MLQICFINVRVDRAKYMRLSESGLLAFSGKIAERPKKSVYIGVWARIKEWERERERENWGERLQ